MYGGQQQGGISTPSEHPIIFLFTGEQGEQYGYEDGWTEEGVFFYTGEGQRGDMSFVRGNRAVRDHAAEGKDLHLFEYAQRGQVRYVGQVVYTGFQYRLAPDVDGNGRRAIVFELTPIDTFTSEVTLAEKEDDERIEQSLDALLQRALEASATASSPSERRSVVQQRGDAIRSYVLRRANGICQGCGKEAPFRTDRGRPYLEPHHIRRLSDGGPDHPRWVIALCPNCHRRAHYGEDRDVFNDELGHLAGRMLPRHLNLQLRLI